MQKLWLLEASTVTELQNSVNAEREEPVSRNTVQVQLQRLEEKGWVEHSANGRVFTFRPTVGAEEGMAELARDFRNKVFGGSSLAMVRCLVDSGDVTDGEIEELRKLINSRNES